MMSYEKSGIKPDMAILGKSLSGGMYSMSMILGYSEALNSVSPGQ
jgi:ornithine--oxo-acid transaminase